MHHYYKPSSKTSKQWYNDLSVKICGIIYSWPRSRCGWHDSNSLIFLLLPDSQCIVNVIHHHLSWLSTMTGEHLVNVTKSLGECKTNDMVHEQAVHVSSTISFLSEPQFIDDTHLKAKLWATLHIHKSLICWTLEVFADTYLCPLVNKAAYDLHFQLF